MTTSFANSNEKIIKSKSRVQKHGEVFTPKKIIEMMLNQPGIKEACEDLTTSFLEPAAGEGAFLVAILRRKLDMVAKTYNKNIAKIENYSLLALSTLYGIELLEDNTYACVMNMYQEYFAFYNEQAKKFATRPKEKVLKSAKKIISSNIEQGDFLTRLKADGSPIILSEWRPINLMKNTTNIRVGRTQYTLDEIYEEVNKSLGEIYEQEEEDKQISFFDAIDDEFINDENQTTRSVRYMITNITDVYLEEVEEFNG